MCEECMGHAAHVKGDEGAVSGKSAGATPQERPLGMTAGGATCALSRSSNDVLGDKSTATDARAACESSFVSTPTNRSWVYTCTSSQRHLCTDCHAREWPSTCNETHWTDRAVFHGRPSSHLCLRLTRATSNCSSSSRRLTRSLSCRRSYPEGDFTADTRWCDYKPSNERCKQRECQHISSNPKTVEQDCTPHPSPDPAGGIWPHTARRRDG